MLEPPSTGAGAASPCRAQGDVLPHNTAQCLEKAAQDMRKVLFSGDRNTSASLLRSRNVAL